MKNIDAVFFAIGYGVGTVFALAVVLYALWVLWYIVVGVYCEIIHLCFGKVYHRRCSSDVVQRVTQPKDAPEWEIDGIKIKNVPECCCQACAEMRRLNRARKS